MKLQQECLFGALILTPEVARLNTRSAKAFRDTVLGAMPASARLVLLDLGAVDRVDHTGIAALMSVLKHGGPRLQLDLCNLSDAFSSKLEACHMRPFFTIHSSRAAALFVYEAETELPVTALPSGALGQTLGELKNA